MNIDTAAKKLAKLQAPTAKLGERKGSSVRQEDWQREDPATIAAAIGSYVARRPKRRFPVMLMMLRYWPEGLRAGQQTALIGITTGILCRRFHKTINTMPEKIQSEILSALHTDSLACQLLREFKDPSLCYRCNGMGWHLKMSMNEDGKAIGGFRVDCTTCGGACTVPKGYKARAHIVGMAPWQWNKHVQAHYDRVLSTYANMADRAGNGIIRSLG